MPASIGVNMRVTGHYSQGGRLHMEDKFSVAYQQTEDERDLEYAYFGIFDGHGGSEAAAYAKDHLMEAIVRQKHFWSDDDADVLRAIRNGYMMTHMNMWKELEKWPKVIHGLPSTAGTTASVAFIRRGKIYIGHVGDSAIVLGYQVDGKEEWCAKPLTMDHKPESAAEMQRIQMSGGKVIPKSGVHRVVWSRFVMGNGKLRHEEIPFLAIARSLGDHWSYNRNTDEFVVSPDPDVGVLNIDPAKFKCLIFGTDGLWNMISPKKAVHLVQQAQKHNEQAALGAHSTDPWLNPSKILVDSAIDRWATTKVRADNTSVVTVMMDPPGPPRSRAPAPPMSTNTKMACSNSKDNDQSEDPCKSDSPAPTSPNTTPKDNSSIEKPTAKSGTSESSPYSPLTIKRANNLTKSVMLGTPSIRDRGVSERGNIITNYGNPSESYFIVRLLNRTQIKNSLQNVYEEIMKPAEVQEQPPEDFPINNNNIVNDLDKSIVKETYELQQPEVPSPVPETILEKPVEEPITPDLPPADTDQQKVEEEIVPENEDTEENTEDSSKPEQESIQINEVSSSSPVDAPTKPGKRKPKPITKIGYSLSQFPPRALRSSDVPQTLSQRPQTRQNVDKNRANAPVTPNIQKKNYNPQVPSPTHTPKPIGNIGKVTTVQQKSKIASGQSTLPRSESKKLSEKNLSDKYLKTPRVSLITAKQEKLDAKGKSSNIKLNDGNTNFSRITRSKDIQSPSDVINKEASQSKKFQPSRDNKLPSTDNQPDRPKTVTRGNTGTRQKTNVSDTVPFCPTKMASSPPKGRNREQVAGSNPECCKENVLTPVCTTPGPVPLNSTKRRNSGGGTGDLEPREKRRTRLGDKNINKERTVQEQHQDITSTESNFVIDMSVCNDQNVIPEGYNQQTLTDTFNDIELKKNKKDGKFVKGSASSNEITGEVHSTTIHIESEVNSKVKGSISLRTLRPRHDLSLSDKKLTLKGDKRMLRSNNCLSEIVCGSSKLLSYKERPILRSRNSVGAIPSKCTPRRRVPWQQTLRHNLRRKLVK